MPAQALRQSLQIGIVVKGLVALFLCYKLIIIDERERERDSSTRKFDIMMMLTLCLMRDFGERGHLW